MNSSSIPAILGGTPVRAKGTFRTTPEVGPEDVAFVKAQILTGDWEPDATRGGIPAAPHLILPKNVAESLGAESAALSAEFAEMQAPGQRVQVVPCNNGTHAIKLALAALSKWTDELGLRPLEVGGEVLVPAVTWQATAGALLRRGLVPVLVPVLPGTLCMDPVKAAAAINDRTVAIIVVHLYDRLADMDEFMKIASDRQLAMIEDCAHAHGAVWHGKGAGTIGHVGTFSGQGSKTLSAGEAGLISTRILGGLGDQLCSVVTCGRQVGASKLLQADNDRMAGAIAALLRAQLRRFTEQNGLRLRTFEDFDSMVRRDLGGLGLGVSLAQAQPGVVTPTYKKVVRIDLGPWGGMSLGQWRAAMEAELGCEFATVYDPLTASSLYAPHSDPALNISEDFRTRIDPSRFDGSGAKEIFETTAVIEHAAFLDEAFPVLFAEAAEKIHRDSARLAAEVTV